MNDARLVVRTLGEDVLAELEGAMDEVDVIEPTRREQRDDDRVELSFGDRVKKVGDCGVEHPAPPS